jgi:hypothetical protein
MPQMLRPVKHKLITETSAALTGNFLSSQKYSKHYFSEEGRFLLQVKSVVSKRKLFAF